MSNIQSAPISKNPFAYLSLAMLAALLTLSVLPSAQFNAESSAEVILASIR